jgi:hypothetical protein
MHFKYVVVLVELAHHKPLVVSQSHVVLHEYPSESIGTFRIRREIR